MKNCIFTFGLTLTLHVTLISKRKEWIRCFSTRAFERRLAYLATTFILGDNLGGGGDLEDNLANATYHK